MTDINHILSETGWKLVQRDGREYLDIDGEQVIYHPFPPAKYEMPVRRMIFENGMSELRLLLEGPWPDPGTSTEELRARVRALAEKMGDFPNNEPATKAAEKALAPVAFELGGRLLREFLDRVHGQEEPRREDWELYREGERLLARAHTAAEFTGMLMLGKHAYKVLNPQRRLARDLRDIANVDEPIEETIAHWYAKIAYTCKNIRQVSAVVGDAAYTEACVTLLQTRPDLPEYAAALSEVETQKARLLAEKHQPAQRTAVEEAYWMARVREPLARSFEPSLIMFGHA
jgi:hypothetical protein